MHSFFFFSYASPFYYVRGASLLSPVAQTLGVNCQAIFQNNNIPSESILVFNRFCGGRFFSSVANWCNELGIPYAFDIDDAYWDLPKHSTDDAVEQASIHHADFLAQKATVIVTTTEYLAEQIRKRFSDKQVLLVPNCTAQSYLSKDGVCIANTDSFKVSHEQLHWFRELLQRFVKNGVAVTLLGENENLLEGKQDFAFQIAGRQPYQEYLQFLSAGHFQFGLVPVEPSLYAECKSDIKLTEFVGAGMRAYVSDIRPYREFVTEYLGTDDTTKLVQLVSHTQEGWEKAADEIIAFYPKEVRDQNAKNLEIQYKSRLKQFEAWEQVAGVLAEQRLKAAKADGYAHLMRKIKNYQFVQRKYNQVRHSKLSRILRYFKK